MIFSIGDHIDQIIKGTKTQTRRPTDRYEVGKTYAIQPGRGKKGIPEGRILMIEAWVEKNYDWWPTSVPRIARANAEAEGGYTQEDYETFYEKMYPDWKTRHAFRFKFVPNEEGMSE